MTIRFEEIKPGIGSRVIWENTSALHRAIPYDPDCGRMMHRTSIAGADSLKV